MADKPCRWLVIETKVHFHCRHPLLWHLNVAEEDSTWGNSEALCHGCPCHEPQGLVFRSAEEVFKHYGVTLTDDGHEPFDPDPTPDTCRWTQDEFKNWFSGCSGVMPTVTPWDGKAIHGMFCPECGKRITTQVHDKP